MDLFQTCADTVLPKLKSQASIIQNYSGDYHLSVKVIGIKIEGIDIHYH